jgi:membrane protease YdiL (CAAX protease family)
MDELSNGGPPPNASVISPRTARLQAAFEVFLTCGILTSLIAGFPFYARSKASAPVLDNVYVTCAYILFEAALTLGLVGLLMSAHRQGLSHIGLHKAHWKSDILTGLALIPVFFAVNAVVATVVRIYFPEHFTSRNALMDIIHTPGQLVLFIFSALVAGGIKEEVQRAFILTRFRDHLGGAWLGLLLWSAAFGAAHYVQGVQGMIAAGIFGYLFGIVYLARGSLIAPMVAHGVYDTIALLGYWFLGH